MGPGVATKAGVMSAGAEFRAAVTALSSALERKTSLCAPFLDVLPVDGVGISTLGVPFGSETVCATDPLAARLDEVQMDLGEGPCWLAKRSRRPVLMSDIRNRSTQVWPIFAEAIRDEDVGGMYAFPLIIGTLSIGAVDLFSARPGGLTDEQVAQANQLSAIAARQVLRRSLSTREPRGDDDSRVPGLAEHSRRVIHQATGMVLVQLDVSADDALLIIRGHAFAHARSVRDIATDIVERRLDLAQVSPKVEN